MTNSVQIFYRISIRGAVLYYILVIGLFLLMRHFLKKYKWWKVLVFVTAIVYIGFLFSATIGAGVEAARTYTMNLVPLDVLYQILTDGDMKVVLHKVQNMVLFAPLGLYLSEFFDDIGLFRNIKWLMMGIFGLVVYLEMAQWSLHVGDPDIEDLFFCTAGGYLGAVWIPIVLKANQLYYYGSQLFKRWMLDREMDEDEELEEMLRQEEEDNARDAAMKMQSQRRRLEEEEVRRREAEMEEEYYQREKAYREAEAFHKDREKYRRRRKNHYLYPDEVPYGSDGLAGRKAASEMLEEELEELNFEEDLLDPKHRYHNPDVKDSFVDLESRIVSQTDAMARGSAAGLDDDDEEYHDYAHEPFEFDHDDDDHHGDAHDDDDDWYDDHHGHDDDDDWYDDHHGHGGHDDFDDFDEGDWK